MSVAKIALFVALSFAALDVRGDAGGNAFQYIGFGVVLGCLIVAVVWESAKVVFPGWLRRPLVYSALFFVFLVTTIIVAVVQSVPLERYGRIVFPIALAWMSALLVLLWNASADRSRAVGRMILLSLGVSSVASLMLGFERAGVGIEDIRFQILTSATPALLAAAVCAVMGNWGRLRTWAALCSSFVFVVVALSATRSLLFGIFASVALVVVSRVRSPFAAFVEALKVAGVGVFAAVGVAIVSMAMSLSIFERWLSRLFDSRDYSGVDITALTRLAEYSEQMRLLFGDPVSAFFGKGYGQSFGWDEIYWDRLLDGVSLSDLYRVDAWYAGHSTWVYSLFTSGLTLGWVVPLVFVFGFVVSVRVARTAVRSASLIERPWYVFLCASFAAAFAQSFTAHALEARYGAMVVGIVLGQICVGYFRGVSRV